MPNLGQINMSFNPLEDRLLLRMTSGTPEGVLEYRVWLTRRFVRLLWDALKQTLEAETAADPRLEPTGRTAIQEFEEMDALSKADFSTPYKPKVEETPLGQEPFLASRLQIRKTPEGGKIMSLLDQEGRGVTLGLNTGMIHAVRKLLVDAVQKAQWDLAISLFSRTELTAAHMPHTIQ